MKKYTFSVAMLVFAFLELPEANAQTYTISTVAGNGIAGFIPETEALPPLPKLITPEVHMLMV